jgi:hypothetical protein
MALQLHHEDPRRLSLMNVRKDSIANSLVTSFCNFSIKFSNQQFKEAMCCHFGLPSPLMSVIGPGVRIKSHQVKYTDRYGYNIKTVTGVEGGDRTICHNQCHSVIAATCKKVGIPLVGEPPETCKNMFNHVLRSDEVNRQGIIPDMTIRMSGNTPESIGPPTTIYENVDSLLDVKTLAPGQAYHKSAAAQAGERAAVEHRQEQVNKDYYAQAKILDRRYNHTREGNAGPIEEELRKFGHRGKVVGIVIGAYSECSEYVHQLAKLAGKYEAQLLAGTTNSSFLDLLKIRAKCTRAIKVKWGLTFHRAWARLLIDRTALLTRPNDITEFSNHTHNRSDENM